jgi:hypothetical protein
MDGSLKCQSAIDQVRLVPQSGFLKKSTGNHRTGFQEISQFCRMKKGIEK